MHLQKIILALLFYLYFCQTYAQVSIVDSLLYETKQLALNTQLSFLQGKLSVVPEQDKQKYLTKALQISRNQKDQRKEAFFSLKLGNYYYYMGDYPKTLSQYQRALNIYTSMNDHAGMGLVYGELAVFTKKQKQYDKALEYLDKGELAVLNVNDSLQLGSIYDIRGMTYADMENFEKAQIEFEKAYALKLAVKDSLGLAYVLNNLADVAIQKKQFERAIQLIQTSTEIRKNQGYEMGIAINYVNMGEVYLHQKKYHLAIQNFEECLKRVQPIGYTDLIKFALDKLANANMQINEYEKAYEFLRQSYSLKDSLLSIEKLKQITEMETKFETEKKEQQILVQNLTITNERERNQQLWVRFIGGIAILLLLGGLIYFYSRNKTQEHLRETQSAHQEEMLLATLNTQEAERKRIARDLHDGIGQQLSGLKMGFQQLSQNINSSSSKNKKQLKILNSILDEASTDVRNLSHQMMPKTLQDFGLVPAIKDMIEKSFLHSSIVYEFDHFGIKKRLPEHIEIGLYRVSQELINNILKHAHATEVNLQLIQRNQSILLIIEDNGSGFDKNKISNKGQGMMNIHSRISSLKGHLDFETSPNKGTLVNVRIALG